MNELYAEYWDIISSINTLKYLEAEKKYSQAVEKDDIDVDNIEALKLEIDRLEVFKPTSTKKVLSVEQVRNKIELLIQTNDIPRAKVLATNRDISGLRSFKDMITELKKHLEDLSPKSDSFVVDKINEKVGSCLYLVNLLELTHKYMTSLYPVTYVLLNSFVYEQILY